MEAAIKAFKDAGIPILQPHDDNYRDYEKAVVTSNLLHRFTRPHCVVQPEKDAHIQIIIKQAKSQKLPLAIRCGGHSYAGFSTALEPNSILVDLRKLNKVKLDLNSDTITVGAGCQWGEVYRYLINGKHDGLIVNGGRCPWVGVGGFILGGGLGPFTRSFGMGSDNLLEATLVTANGEIVTVSTNDDMNTEKGQLLWALRGAGSANFGIVTQIKLKIQHLQNKEGTVVAGRYLWFPKDNDTLLSTMNDFYKTDWPKEMTIDTSWICDLRESTGDGVRFTVYFDGTESDFDTLIDEHITHKDVRSQLKKRTLPEPSTRFLYESLEDLWFDESKKFFAENKTYRIFTSFVFTRQQVLDNIDKITQIVKKNMELFRSKNPGESVSWDMGWVHAGGQASKIKSDETAYFWREANYHAYVEVLWKDKWMERLMRGFMATLKQELRPYSINNAAVYFNFPDRDLEQGAYERAYFGDNRTKLRKVKEIWDPDNVFKWAQGIQLPKDAVDDSSIPVDLMNFRELTDSIAQDVWAKLDIVDLGS